jgi:urease accessory protein
MARIDASLMTGIALSRLLQLASPALPVGGYSYSQALEWAVAQKTVCDAASAARWIGDSLAFGMGRFEAPVWVRLYHCWRANNVSRAESWNARFCASRETAELFAESTQMGFSLARLVGEARFFDPEKLSQLRRLQPISFPAAYSFVAANWDIPLEEALLSYLWSWLENQVTAAVKLIPLGQSVGQKMLVRLADNLPDLVCHARSSEDDALSNLVPGLAIASSRHETQYSRVFRS